MDQINYAQVVLIPMDTAESISEYRPISLLNCIVKILAKVLANKLASRLHELIGEYQTVFIKGRTILDGNVKMHGVVHRIKRSRKTRFILKLDFEKV